MARISNRPQEDEEDFIEDDEEQEEEEQVSAPAVSDSRRRRKMKRGELTADSVDVQPSRSKDRPTPSQRPVALVETTNPVLRPIVRAYRGVVEYFQEVRSELGKVAWLSREEMLRLTYIVLVVTTISAVFLGVVSFAFALLTQAMTTSGGSLIAGGVVILLIIGVAGAWLLRERLFGGHFE